MIWLYALASVVIVSLISLIGLITFPVSDERLRKMLFILVALAVGALFGDTIIHLLPEIFSATGGQTSAVIGMLAGILIFFILEKFLHWRHSHTLDDCGKTENGQHQTIKPVGHLSLIADGLHNLIDGIIIGVSYLVSPAVGLATTLAVILHEIPDEIGNFGVLIHAGFSRRQAIGFNALSASLAIVGTVVALAFGTIIIQFTSVFLALAAGGFLYIAGSDLVPELHKTTDLKKSALQLLAIIIGISLMLLLKLID
ncbi:MAG: ZIP family metal transporter [Candidatus Vogelbacteria bacterium]